MAGDSDTPYNPLTIDNISKGVVRELESRAAHQLRLPMPRFEGAGVYALYYVGQHKPFAPYRALADANKSGLSVPIYVGRARPKGGRKGTSDAGVAPTYALSERLAVHALSISKSGNLELANFRYRYLVVMEMFIDLAELALINAYKPLWNIGLDGFGNKTPGKRRMDQQRSEWDEVHFGRYPRMHTPNPLSVEDLHARIEDYLGKDTSQIPDVTTLAEVADAGDDPEAVDTSEEADE